MLGQRPKTAFELFLQSKRQGGNEPDESFGELRPGSPRPLHRHTASEGAARSSVSRSAPQAPAAALPPPARAPERRWQHDNSGEQVQAERLQRLLNLSQYTHTQPQQAPPHVEPTASSSSSSPDRAAPPKQQRTSRTGSQARQQPARLSAPEVRPLVAAARSHPNTGAADVVGAANHQPPTAPARTPASTAVYGELASAAASLASAAHKLARGSAADRTVAASYETLAQAAADLAASACQISPRAGGAAAAAAALGGRPKAGAPAPLAPLAARARAAAAAEERAGQLLLLPRAVDPMAAAAALDAGAGGAAAFGPGRGPGGGGASHGGASPAPSAAGGGGGRARVAAPRFPGYNPLIHLLSSQLPLPGTPGLGRPATSSPITHQLEADKPLHSSAGRSTAAGSSQYGRGGSQYGHASPHRLHREYGGHTGGSASSPAAPPLLQPSDLHRLPVLSLSADGAAQGFSAGAAGGEVWSSQQLRVGGGRGGGGGEGGGGGGALPPLGGAGARADGAREVDPLTFLAPYSDVRLPQWPPTEPVTLLDMDQDELDRRYNKVLAALRERLTARGPGRLAAAFRDADAQGSGLVSREGFLAVLQGMNLGATDLVDGKVVDLMLSGLASPGSAAAAAMSGGGGGSPAVPAQQQGRTLVVSYGDFVNALRFGALPWRGYNRKLRHRLGGDPDHPFGPAGAQPPYGIMPTEAAAAPPAPPAHSLGAHGGGGGAHVAGGGGGSELGARWEDLRAAFRDVDHNRDGVVEWGEFREALQRVGQRHGMQLSEEAVLQVYSEIDPERNHGVDYAAFEAMYGGGPAYVNNSKRAAGGNLPLAGQGGNRGPHGGGSSRPPTGGAPGAMAASEALGGTHASAAARLKRLSSGVAGGRGADAKA